MKVRFQADADFNAVIIKAVLRQEPSIDFRTAHAAGLPGLSDLEVLSIAARSERLLVTHDRKTIPHQFATFITTETSSGVLVVSQRLRVTQVVEDLLLIWSATEADEWINRIYVLPL
jgi:hypothetical protein